MRYRTNGARVALHLILTLAFVAPVVMGPGAPALADHCSGEGSVRHGGGEVAGECHGNTPDRPGDTTQDARWARYCAPHVGPYVQGDEVVFYALGPLTPEEIEIFELDPTALYVWVEVICWRNGVEAHEFQVIVEDTPPVSPELLRDRAVARISPPRPAPVTSPPLARFSVVRIPTWLWLDTDYWQPLEVSESQGLVSVTVRATPSQALWNMGDGGDVACSGPGVEWRSGLSEDATDCSYTYLHSSYGRSDGQFDASVTVVWEFEWWLNGAYQGSFGSVDVSTDFFVAVGEIQAIETRGG